MGVFIVFLANMTHALLARTHLLITLAPIGECGDCAFGFVCLSVCLSARITQKQLFRVT